MAWKNAGISPGIQIWRIEHFHVVDWPSDRNGTFYDGDSYIILHVGYQDSISQHLRTEPPHQTYKKAPDSEALSYDLHFWLGENTTLDEAGTAAYKTVELDDRKPIFH